MFPVGGTGGGSWACPTLIWVPELSQNGSALKAEQKRKKAAAIVPCGRKEQSQHHPDPGLGTPKPQCERKTQPSSVISLPGLGPQLVTTSLCAPGTSASAPADKSQDIVCLWGMVKVLSVLEELQIQAPGDEGGTQVISPGDC